MDRDAFFKEKAAFSSLSLFTWISSALVLTGVIILTLWIVHWIEEARVMKKMIERLSADSRIAEVLVTKSEYDETTKKVKTTIKFLEYASDGSALSPHYFSFQGNLIQFQSLVVRFQDKFVKSGDPLRGKSVFLFMKAFVLDGDKTQSFDITQPETIPEGYRVSRKISEFERKVWARFWRYALDPSERDHMGIKNAQIEAPGSLFLPGTIYTLKIEHDGGIRIDTRPVPDVLKGEKL